MTEESPIAADIQPTKKSIFDILPVRLGITLNVLVLLELILPYSLRGVWADVCIFVGAIIVAAFDLVYVVVKRKTLFHKWLLPLSQLPSYLVLLLLLVCIPIPGLLFGPLFAFGEIAATHDLFSSKSPDDSFELTVRYIPVGAYTGGAGRYRIVKTRWWLPVVETSVFYDSHTDKPDTDTLFLIWISADSILIEETNERIAVD
jgi:hypothetical protein